MRGLSPEFLARYPTKEDRDRHRAYIVAQCQARYRGETWDLSEEDYLKCWGDQWYQRGRGSDNTTLTRKDWDGPWSRDNIEIITRREFWHRIHEVQDQNGRRGRPKRKPE